MSFDRNGNVSLANPSNVTPVTPTAYIPAVFMGAPGPIGETTPDSGAFTTITASSTLAITGAVTFSGTLALAGNLVISTNQFTVNASNGNTVIAGTVSVAGKLTATKGTLKGITALTPASTVSIDPTLGDIFTLAPGQDETINFASVPATAQEITLIITTSGATSRTLTFNTNAIANGTLATGTVTAKKFIVKFVSDGTNFIESSRTTAM